MSLNSWGKIKKKPQRTSLGFGMTAQPHFSPKMHFPLTKDIFNTKSLLPASSEGETEKYVQRSKPELEQCLAAVGDEI